MSLQRACVNCERCYALVTYADNTMARNIDPTSIMYTRPEIYRARNEAMKALEEIMMLNAVNGGHSNMVESSNSDCLAEKALKACRSCSYEEPRIVKVIEERKTYPRL